MIATLSSYDRFFGPRHITTLSLTAHIAELLWSLGESQRARSILERVIRDMTQSVGRTNLTRIAALHSLRDLLVEQAEIRGAITLQTEIVECLTIVAGPGAPETITAKADLGELLMSSLESGFEN